MSKPSDTITLSMTQYIENLRYIFKYDPIKGELSNYATGEVFGREDANGIMIGTCMGKSHTIPKFIWMHQHGTVPKGQVRLINPDLPPTIDNLYDTRADGKPRLTKARLDPHTVHHQSQLPKSGVRGVTWQSTHNSWRVVLRGVYYGSYKNLDQARKRYDQVVRELIEADAQAKRKHNLATVLIRESEHPSVAELEDMFVYDPETGYLHERNPGRRGQPYSMAKDNPLSAPRAGTYYNSTHPYTHIRGRKYYIAQLVWALHHGEIPETYRTLNGNPQDTRIANITDKPVDKEIFPYAREYHQPKAPAVESVESVKQDLPIEEDEYDIAYGDYLYHKHEDGRYSYTNQSRETKYGTQEQIRAYLDDVINGDGWGSIVKWGELASA